MWKAAQRFTKKPVKFGAVTAELVGFAVQDKHYKNPVDRIFAIADAFNEEYHELADAGCPVIQIEEPQIHLLAARGVTDPVINPKLMLEIFNPHREGAARQDRGLGAFVLGQSVPAAHVRAGAELQGGARSVQRGGRRRGDVRIVELARHGPRGDRQVDHRQEDRNRGDRSSHACRSSSPRRSRSRSAPR